MDDGLAVTKSQLVNEITNLGLSEGQTVMLHASVKSIGHIAGGPQTILDALFEILTPRGTLMILVGWEDNPYNIFDASFQDDIDKWPENKRRKFYDTCPAFDPEHSRSDIRKMGILTEYLRTHPGSIRSRHPLGYAAVGKLAQYLLKDQQWQYREGSGSPLEKLCDVGGKVLLLGAPTSTVTLIHSAENHVKIPNKKTVRYKMPILQDGVKVWKDFEEYDFINGIVPWPEDYFKSIVDEYIEKGNGAQGTVGMAECHLFDAKELNNFAINWMERNFLVARSAIDWFNEGLKCFNQPDGIGAVNAFEAVVKIDPFYRHEDGDNPYFYLGKISEMEERFDNAIQYYSSALTLDPYDEESLIGRGSCHTVKKNHESAVADFKKVLDIPPESRNAPLENVLYAIAENYRQQKDLPNALDWGEKALLQDPDNHRHQEWVAEVKKQMRDVP